MAIILGIMNGLVPVTFAFLLLFAVHQNAQYDSPRKAESGKRKAEFGQR
jgi:hypothetical protein